MPKVAILHPGIYGNPKNDALTSSFLADVTVVRYTAGMTKEELLAAIPAGLTHVSFVYHYPGYSRLPFFADRSGISSVSGEKPKYRYFSDTVIDILRSLSVSSVTDGLTVDILSCNLNEAAYAEEVKKIETDLGINIRFSVDKTGNPSGGANWILESEEPAVNVRDIYFTDGVLAWNGVLTTDITSDVKNNDYALYISWNGGTNTFTVQQNFIWTVLGLVDPDSFITLGAGETFDGNNKTIDISGLSWDGLIASSATSFPTAPLIKNLGVINGDIGVPSGGGAIVRLGQQFFKVENCYSTGAITDLFAGGIAGGSAGGGLNGECDISGCYSTGDISGQNAGGIVGLNAGDFGGLCRITNCYSTGDIIGPTAGGIAGEGAGQLGSCIITNCYSSGDIIGADAGGIAGQIAGNSGICTITDCYSTGYIIGQNAGGIAGAVAGTNAGTCTISGCYSTGYIDASGGGIVGALASFFGTCIISECYSTGDISGDDAGGIAGIFAGNDGTCTISNCYSTGPISGGDAGGIAGANTGAAGGTCSILDCYSAGVISGGNAGGIAGSNAGTCTIICCVCNGGTIFGNGIPIDPLDCSTDLADISGVIFPCWLPSLIWESGGPVPPPTNYNLPILTRFRNSPWDSAFYNAADDPAQFITPPVVLTNTFPLRVNPYIAIGTILVYTNSFIRALVAGTTLPNPGRTAWSIIPLPAGTLLKPLGRSAVVNGINKLAIYRFENVQLINGPSSEGVPSGDATGRWYTGWICTWSADGVAPVFP